MTHAASRYFLWSVLACAAAGTAAPALAAERGPLLRSAASATAAAEREARVIVKFKADTALVRIQSAPTANAAVSAAAGPQHAQALGLRLGLALADGRVLGPRSQLVTGSGIRSADLAARLAAQPDVEYAEVDARKRPFAAPNDPLYAAGQATTPAVGQWYLRAPNATTVSAINAEAAWAITTGKPSIVVAVIDTGVRPEHPDLQGKLLPGYDFVGNVSASNDGDGRDSDPSDPGDYVVTADVGVVTGCTQADVGSSSWHGTETAGLIGAATNNRIGMASVGRDVMLLPLRVFGKCGGFDSDIQDAMRWAVGLAVAGTPQNTNPAKVLNLSLGGPQACSQSYKDVIAEVTAKGAVIVVAAGNEGLSVDSPANCPGVIAVAGVRHAGTKVGYSSLGPEVTLSAPAGNCVNTVGTCLYPLLTTFNSGAQGPENSIYSDGVKATLGTSFSTPLVAGTVGLMFSVNPALTVSQVISILQGTARSFPSSGAASDVRACRVPSAVAQSDECYCTTVTCGAGMLDAGAAVGAAQSVWANISVSPTYPLVGRSVGLAASAFTASGAAAVRSYAWEVARGTVTFTSGTTSSSATVLPGAAAGSVVRVTAIDANGARAVAETNLSVSGPPVASINVGAATSAVAGAVVSLDGSASSAGDTGSMKIEQYSWVITSGGGLGSLSSSTSPTVTLTTRAAGVLTVSLTVTDTAGQQTTTSTVVTVAPVAVPPSTGGGGGAMEFGWLLGWLASVIGVWAVTPRRRG
jgi:serine protease